MCTLWILSFLISQRRNTVCFLGVQDLPPSAKAFGVLTGGRLGREGKDWRP